MDKREKTIQELNAGLKSMVGVMLFYRKHGCIENTRRLKQFIDTTIAQKDLDADVVYFCYGNPDDPMQKVEVYGRAERLEMVI